MDWYLVETGETGFMALEHSIYFVRCLVRRTKCIKALWLVYGRQQEQVIFRVMVGSLPSRILELHFRL